MLVNILAQYVDLTRTEELMVKQIDATEEVFTAGVTIWSAGSRYTTNIRAKELIIVPDKGTLRDMVSTNLDALEDQNITAAVWFLTQGDTHINFYAILRRRPNGELN